jgi:hypothetical protein
VILISEMKTVTTDVPTNEARATREMKSGFAFIVSHLDVQVALPVSITPTLRLEAASDAQIDEIRRFVSMGDGLSISYHYEHEWIAHATEHGTGHLAQPLSRDRWRYFLITWCDWNAELLKFQKAVNLVPPGIFCYSAMITDEVFGKGAVVGRHIEGTSIPATYRQIPPTQQIVDAERVEAWRRAFAALERFDVATHPGIARAVDLFDRINRLPLTDDFRVLGLFMALEMLLTHNPNEKEIGDSLSHQICTKVALLERRLTKPLNYAVFSEAKSDVVWKKLYAFRSAIAHGGVSDFKGVLRVLQSPQAATEFLTEVTALILRHALDEPALFDSLKPI